VEILRISGFNINRSVKQVVLSTVQFNKGQKFIGTVKCVFTYMTQSKFNPWKREVVCLVNTYSVHVRSVIRPIK